jgi:hypothetical protein
VHLSAAQLVRECETQLEETRLKMLAVVRDRDAFDIGLLSPAGPRIAIRCVARTCAHDHTALATMMAEGDFVWAGLVYGEREGSETVGLIETFHVSELDRLVSRLLELREVFGEPG